MNQLIVKTNELRLEHKCSLLSIAEASNMHYAGIYKIFKGSRIPQIDTLERILDAMGYKLKIVPKDENNQ